MISQPNLRRFLGFHRLVIEVRTWLGCEASFVRDYRAFHNGPSACSLSLLFSELGIFTHWSRNLYLVFCELGLLNQPCSYLHISREIFSNLFLSFTHNKELKSQSTRRYRSTNAGPLVFRGGQVCSLRSHPRPGHPVRRVQTLRAHDGQR